MTKIGLRSWLLIGSLLPALLVSVFSGGYFSYVRHQELQFSLSDRARQIAIPLSISASRLMAPEQYLELQKLIDLSHRYNSPHLSSISVFNAQNQLLYSSNPQLTIAALRLNEPQDLPTTGLETDSVDSLILYQPLPEPQQGYLVLQLQKDQLYLRQQSSALEAVLMIFTLLLLCCAPAFYLLIRLYRPIRQMQFQVMQLSSGKTPAPGKIGVVRELAQLQQGINQLGSHLGAQEQEMQLQIEQANSDLQQSMEQLEVHNIQLDFARRKAQEENRQKSEFLAKMSHELRTPLNGVIGFTRQLLKTQLSSNQHDYLTTIQKSANNLLHLVNDVLDFSKLEEGRLSINPEPFSLRDLLNDATELLAANAFDKHLELVLMVEPGCPDDLLADPKRFGQVLMNIAGNAIKFTDHGSIIIRVSATLLNEDQLILHCSVQDTGRGISDEQQNQLFQGFGSSEPKSHQTGSGLGLMISQRLVQAMGGNIGFESKQSEGSTFWFTIKCQRHQLTVAESLPTEVLENKQLLYFEPQQHSREATLSLLHSWGMQVTACATKGQLQQALAHQQRYDIGLIGRTVAINQVNQILSVIQQIKPQCQYTYLLVNTLSPSLRETMLSSGADACLSKPPHQRKLAMTLSHPYSLRQPEPGQQLSATQTGLKVLTVDDNDANLKLINTLLAEQVEHIDSARDGAEAWHKATQHAYDLIFMDINMPVMDGVTACQRIRQSSLNEHTPIVAVTAHAIDGERARLITLGFNEFLSKPLDEKMLQCTLQEFCQTKLSTTVNSSSLPNSKLIDWQLALERASGKCALMKEMLQMLISSITPCRNAIQHAIAINDSNQLLQQVHKLHGACCYTGVPRLKQLAELIETQLKQGISLTTLEPELFELDDVLQALWQESRTWPEW